MLEGRGGGGGAGSVGGDVGWGGERGCAPAAAAVGRLEGRAEGDGSVGGLRRVGAQGERTRRTGGGGAKLPLVRTGRYYYLC